MKSIFKSKQRVHTTQQNNDKTKKCIKIRSRNHSIPDRLDLPNASNRSEPHVIPTRSYVYNCDQKSINYHQPDLRSSNENMDSIQRLKFTPLTSSSRLQSTLNHILTTEKCDRNDVTVLSLGINHYLEEVFNALDSKKCGYVDASDLEVLCKILGKKYNSYEDQCSNINHSSEESCSNQMCPIHIHCSKFVQIMTDLFTSSTDSRSSLCTLNNSKLIETVVSVSRRTSSLQQISEALDQVEESFKGCAVNEPLSIEKYCDRCRSKLYFNANKNDVTQNNHQKHKFELQRIVLLQIQELQCMREIVEDLRVALQTCDAENLGLKVNQEKMINQLRDCFCNQVRLFPDEQDSIDQLIINFPSSEYLDPPQSSGKTEEDDIKQRANIVNAKNESLEKININHEITTARELLNEARFELSGAKNSLNQSLEFQKSQMHEMSLNYKELETNLREQNSRLRDEVIYFSEKSRIHQTNEEVLLISEKDNLKELRRLKTTLESTKKCRQRDLKMLCQTRELLSQTFKEITKTEETLKLFMRQESTPIETILKSNSPTKLENSFSKYFMDDKILHRNEEFTEAKTKNIFSDLANPIIKAKKRLSSDQNGFEPTKVARFQDHLLNETSTVKWSHEPPDPNLMIADHNKSSNLKISRYSDSPITITQSLLPNKATSTQILESLEAQVEMLKKVLDEDSYGID